MGANLPVALAFGIAEHRVVGTALRFLDVNNCCHGLHPLAQLAPHGCLYLPAKPKIGNFAAF